MTAVKGEGAPPCTTKAAEAVAAAGKRVVEACELKSDEKQDVSKILSVALGDASLVNLKAGPTASLVAACRKAVETAPPAGVERERKLDYAACEVLQALWADSEFCEAWRAAGHAEELSSRCPLSDIVGGARFALGYGDAAAQRMYFSNFSRLSTHAGMMADDTRTKAYHRAILNNRSDFEGKVVMDVGSGSGVLAFFAVQAGAAKVYCIEASPMAKVIRQLADANGWGERVVVVNKVLQEIRNEVPEKVDCIISETLGNCLFAERGIETVIVAREKFLKPDGKLFPCKATFAAAPFSDDARFKGRNSEALYFWTNTNFYGINMSTMQDAAREEVFRRPCGENFHPDQLKAQPVLQDWDLRTLRSEELANFKLEFNFQSQETCVLHGVATWFEVYFEGTDCTVMLSTSPWDTLTHWWQTRLMLLEPLAVNTGQMIAGMLDFAATEQNTYDVRLVMEANGTKLEHAGMSLLDLDINHRHVQHKQQAISSTRVLQVPDYEGTKPAPTGGKEYVADPCRQQKIDATQSEAKALNQFARKNRERPFGSQLKVNDQTYLLVDEQELCQQLVGSKGGGLSVVGHFDGTMLFAPQSNPNQFMIQYSTGKTPGMQVDLWMEKSMCTHHIQQALLQRPTPGRSQLFTPAEVGAMSFEQLWAQYEQQKGSS